METITSFIDGGGNVLVAASSDIGKNFQSSFSSIINTRTFQIFIHQTHK